MPIKVRALLLQFHRWSGIAIALWLFVAGFTGILLVFEHEIDMALNPEFYTPKGGETRTLDEQLQQLEKQLPDYFISSIDIADSHTPVTMAYLQPRTASGGGSTRWQAALDPQTGEVLGLRDRVNIGLDRANFTLILTRLHYSLYLGDGMAWVFGLTALIWLLNHLFAPLLSFPFPKKWRSSFRIRREARGTPLLFDLHRALTLWLFPVTLVLALSAIYLNWGTTFREVITIFSPVSQEYDQTRSVLSQPLYDPAITYGKALALAQRSATGAQVDGLSYNVRKGLYRVRFFDARDVDPTTGRRYVFVDAAQVLVTEGAHITERTASDLVLAWMFPLHSGKAFGWTGRLIIALAGVAICLFVVTGIWLWLRRRQVRASARAVGNTSTVIKV